MERLSDQRLSDQSLDDLAADMEPTIHDLRDLIGAIEYIAAGAGTMGREIPAHIGLSISTIASESLLKIETIHTAWHSMFLQICGRELEPALNVCQSTRTSGTTRVGRDIRADPPPAA